MAVKEAKYMWMGKDGKIHYIDKQQFIKAMEMLEKGANIGIKIAIVNGVTLITGGPVFAAGMSLAEGLQPIVDMIAECAYPIAGGYMVKGFLKVTQGKEEEGKKILKDAGLGYIGTLFIPQILRFLGGLELFA